MIELPGGREAVVPLHAGDDPIAIRSLSLDGEDVVGVTVGASHVGAWSTGGDLFVWGFNLCGQLGLGDTTQRRTWTRTRLPDGARPT